MDDRFCRLERLVGSKALGKLRRSHVAVFGVGGVGGYAVEALARSGIGALTLVDSDEVALSDINRQIIALTSSVGRAKVEVAAERVRNINPDCRVVARKLFYLPETAEEFLLGEYDYIVDAVDTVTAKVELAVRASECGAPLISCMGTGNKLDPTQLAIADIYSTSVCPLARVMRRELRKRGVEHLKVLYSREQPRAPIGEDSRTPASTAFVPSAAGLIIASEVVRDLLSV